MLPQDKPSFYSRIIQSAKAYRCFFYSNPSFDFELNGGFLFVSSYIFMRIFMIEKIKVCKSEHLQFDIIAYLTTKRASYKYNRRFYLHTIDGI